jgi:hypothetical protein
LSLKGKNSCRRSDPSTADRLIAAKAGYILACEDLSEEQWKYLDRLLANPVFRDLEIVLDSLAGFDKVADVVDLAAADAVQELVRAREEFLLGAAAHSSDTGVPLDRDELTKAVQDLEATGVSLASLVKQIFNAVRVCIGAEEGGEE